MCASLVEGMCDNCDGHCYCSLFLMNVSSILMVPRVVIVAHCYNFDQNNSNDVINSCKACNTVNLHTL